MRDDPGRIPYFTHCKKCGEPVGQGHEVSGICSYCIFEPERVTIKPAGYIRNTVEINDGR